LIKRGKKIFLFIFCITLLLVVTTACKTSAKPKEPKQVPLFTKWPFPVGAAVTSRALSSRNEQYSLLSHFNVLAAENEMTPEALLPSAGKGAYRWAGADTLVNYAQDKNVKIRGASLVCHKQTPAWFFEGSGKDGLAAKEQLYAGMENYIKTVFEKYGGKIGWWNVCGEVVGDDGTPRSAASSKYTAIMSNSGLAGMNRYEYVLQAFNWTRKYADANGGRNVKLYLNDYNIEYDGAKQSEFLKLVNWLIENNAPIDGIGLECHIKWDWPSTAQISGAIDKFSAITRKDGVKLMTQITELDMSLFSSNESDYNRGHILLTLPDVMRDRRLPAQAVKYRELFDMFKTKYREKKLDMVLIWGLADGHSWLNNSPAKGRTDYPLLFDRSYKPKQAYWELVK
jgi:endo-1,4-beta-xylanase